MFKKLMFAAYAAVMMSFTTLAGNATWQLASGQAFRGDGQACLYQTYTDNDGADWYTVDLGDVVSAFANGTLDLSNPPRSTGYSGANGVKGPADVVDGVFAPQATTLGNMNDWYFSLVALVKVNGQDMLYVSGLNEEGGEGKYTTLLEFSLGTAEYDATGGYKGKGYYRRPVPTAKAVVENDGKTLRFVYDTADYGTKGTGWFSVAEAEAIGSISEDVPWRDCSENVTNVIFDASFAAYKPAQFINWFYEFYHLAAIDGLENLDTSAAADFSFMFAFCVALTDLDVSGFDTANATNMNLMFGSCWALTSLDVSGFNTANVVNMDGLFYECSSLTDLDVTHFDTSKVTDMDGMFANCYALASLDVTGFDTANVTNMYEMFYACSSLMSLDVTGFDTSKVTDMYDMFGWCESLASLDVTGFDTAQVTDMGGMFYSCGALTSLDLTGFDTAMVKNMSYMFYDATNLATIVACDSFATSALNSDEKMFRGCVKLVGGNGTAFDAGMIDATAARIDRAGAPGYFTAPPPGTFFTLSFDANGGDDYAHSQMILSTNALRTLPSAVPTRPAYKFLGWATTADGEAAYQAGDRYATGAAGASATLYAKWVNVGDYTIRFDGNSAKATGVPEDIVTPYGSKPTIPADPARDYWTFDGWTNAVNDHVYHAGDLFDEGCEGSSVFVLYAKWSAASASDLEYVDAAGSTWTYDRKGDEVTITDFTPGAEATDATPPTTIDDCTVTNPDFDPGLVYSAGAWLTYSISSGKASITGFVGTLPADLVIPSSVTAGVSSCPVTKIGDYAFDAITKPHRTTLKSVVIPGSVKVIDSAAFRYCEALETVTLGEGVERICTEAFIYAGVKLAEIEFPDSLTYIGGNAFWNVRRECDYAADGGRYADTGHTFLIAIDPDLEGEVVVADTVKITGDGACMNLKATSVVFPSGLEVFGRNSTFRENSHTVAVTLPGSARLGEGTYDSGSDYVKTVTVKGAPPSWNLTSIFTAVEKIVYNIAYANEWANYIETYHLDAAMFEATIRTEPSGRYVTQKLDDAGVVIPDDVDYAAGDKVTVKVEGLAKGLKVVVTPVYEDPDARKKVVVDYVYTIEGVPTEAIDFETRPMYARVTTTYKDKTKGDKGKVETLQPIVLSITTPDPSVLTAGVLNQVYGPADIATLWPEVADAKVNPRDWTFKGWPAGLKYNATAKDASWSYKKDGATVRTTAAPYTVYGQPTKAGEYPITATWKHKLADNKTTVSETFSAVLTVWGDDGTSAFRYTDQAYVATATKTLDATYKSFTGLPTGIKWTAKPVTTKNKDMSVTTNVVAYSLYGTPTKAGVFAVTVTKADNTKETFLWKVAPATAPTFALDTGTAPVEDLKAQIVQGANQSFSIATSDIAAKVTVTGLPTGLKLVQDKTTGLYTVEGVASKPGEYFVTFKTTLNGVTTVTTTAFTVKGNPFTATYCGYLTARPAVGAPNRLAIAEVTVAAAGTVKLTYTEGKTKYTASVKSFDWNDTTGWGKAEGLVLKVSSADKQLGYGDRKATVAFNVHNSVLYASLFLTDAEDTMLMPWAWDLHATVKETVIPLPASQTFVFRTEDGADTNALATVSIAYDANKATAAFSGKLYDGTAVKATVPVLRQDEEGTSDDYVFAPFMIIAKDGTVYRFDRFSSDEGGGYIDWVGEDGEVVEEAWSASDNYPYADQKFAELVPEAGTFTFGWGSDAETVGAATEPFTFEVTKDKNNKPTGVAIYDVDPQPAEKPIATVTAKVGKTTGAISVSFTSKKGNKAKYAVELVWRGDQLFAGHVTRTWKEVDPVTKKSANLTAYGTAEVK